MTSPTVLAGPEAEAPPAAPVAEPARIGSLDVLRGFALLGILVMNIQGFAMPGAAYLNPSAWGDLRGPNLAVWVVAHLLTDLKMMAIFSMLFGAGILVFTDRAAAKGRSPVWLHNRRTLWLLLFGAAHAYLLWHGDVLFTYAVSAFVVVWFRRLSPAALVVLATLVLAVPSAINVSGGLAFPSWPPEDQAGFVEEVWRPSPETMDAEVAAFRGGWLEQMGPRVHTTVVFQTVLLATFGFWRAAGMMLLGMALFRMGVLSAERSVRFYRNLALAGATLGLPVVALGIVWNVGNGWGPSSFFFGGQFNYWGSVPVSLAWVGLVMLLYRKGVLAGFQRALAAVGRTSFSNYILQTLVCTLVFYGHGLGLFGSVERTGQIAVVFAVWALQLTVSPLWLRRFRFGPLEWLWRSLTYGRLQPMRRASWG